MFKQLQDVVGHYHDLARQLSEPGVTDDSKRFQKLAKEHAGLRELVEAYEKYLKVKGDLDGNKELLGDADEGMRQMAKEEIPRLEKEVAELEEQLKFLLLPKDPNDDKNIFLEIRAGTGGDEAALFVADLFRMYSRYAESRGWRVELMDTNATGIGGYKEVIVLITGEKVYSDLKYEGGVHRVQRVPQTEQQGRVHTSTVTVAVLPEVEDVEVNIQEKDLKVDVMRAGGPGGQSVNTTDSAVRLTYIPTGEVVICRDEKSQHKNKAKALRILQARLLEAERAKQEAEISSQRKSMVGTGERSEKIRTYNYPQNRLTDHRIGLTLHNLDMVMEGQLNPIIQALRAQFQAEALKGQAS
ncbi:MAG: peptide chain release factor 1 [Deltaproteobacteria bacterium]|nr:peptide chain release factor 1 [Deltaproteobacteria bacterium]